MNAEKRAILGIFCYCSRLLGAMLIALFAVDMLQHSFGSRVIYWHREVVVLISGFIWFGLGWMGLRYLKLK